MFWVSVGMYAVPINFICFCIFNELFLNFRISFMRLK